MKSFLIIAIDGGAASGKSTASATLAENLHFLHVDTGFHYRAVTFYLLKKGVALDSEKAIEKGLERLELGTEVQGQTAYLILNGKAFSLKEVRSEDVNQAVSVVAAIPYVRQFLLEYQRSQVKVARDHHFSGIVMEGRDIGSVVLRNADLRVFLYADVETRMRRRAHQGEMDSIEHRDKIDSTRKAAPLVQVPGAVMIDTTDLSKEGVVELILEKVKSINDELTSEGKFVAK